MDVTGNYIDFPANGTTDIQTNVVCISILYFPQTEANKKQQQTLGVRDVIPIPVTFYANVYLDFDDNCNILAVRAFAQIPTLVLGLILNPPGIPAGTLPDGLISALLGGL